MNFRQWLEYTERELEQMPIEKLDQMAFGFHDQDILMLPIDQITIILPNDLAGAEWAMQNGVLWDDIPYYERHKHQPRRLRNATPQNWAKQIDRSEPCEVHFRNGRFELHDGHHRYLAAKILNEPLKCQITIDDNPIQTILNKQNRSWH